MNKILIGYTTGDWARRSDFYDHLFTIEKPDGCETIILPSHDRSPAAGRNFLIRGAIELGCSHILIMDDDVIPPTDGLKKLLSHNKDVVTGLVLGGSYPHSPLVFDVANDKNWVLPMYLNNPPGLEPIVNCGFGFVLININIFSKLEKPWVRLGELDPENWCDDIGFFNRVRTAGFNLYCDTSVMVEHIKSMTVKPEYKDGKWSTIVNTGGPEAIRVPQMVKPTVGWGTKEERDGLGEFVKKGR